MLKALTLEQSADQSRTLRDIEDLLSIWVDVDSDSRRIYWILIDQRIQAAIRSGCTNQDVFNSVAISRGLKAIC